FSFNATATTYIYTLSLHDALPISQADSEAHIVYTNDQTNGDLVVIDPVHLEVKARIPLGVKGNHGLYLDLPRNLAFIASETDNEDRKSTRLNSSHDQISYAVFCLK